MNMALARSPIPDWQRRIRYREDLDFDALLSAMRRSQALTRDMLDNKGRPDADVIAELHDDLSDRIAEVEHLVELEAEARKPKRIVARQDMVAAE